MIADGLAFQLFQAAFLRADILEDDRQRVPIGHRRIEDPGKLIADRGGRKPIGHREHRNLVDRGLRDQLQRDAGGPWIDDDRLLVLHLLVAFDALLGVVAGLAFLDHELDAADAAVAGVEHVEIVMLAVRDRDAGAGERPGAISEKGNVDLLLCGCRRNEGHRADRSRERRARNQSPYAHFQFLHWPPFVTTARSLSTLWTRAC